MPPHHWYNANRERAEFGSVLNEKDEKLKKYKLIIKKLLAVTDKGKVLSKTEIQFLDADLTESD